MEKFIVNREDVGLFVGKGGSTKKLIEKECSVRITISRNGEVTISGDAVGENKAIKILEAITFGFSVQIAILLKDSDYLFEKIDIKNYAKSKNRLSEIKARLIGTAGRVKATIENLIDVDIFVSESQVGIIGRLEDMPVARDAIQALLRGAKHSRIFKWLEHRDRHFRSQS